jgi:hypothetical protein
MQSFCDAFRRTADGSWLCIEPAVLQGPPGRIEVSRGSVFRRGTKVMGLDLAEFLDVEDFVRAETATSFARISKRSRYSRRASAASPAAAL